MLSTLAFPFLFPFPLGLCMIWAGTGDAMRVPACRDTSRDGMVTRQVCSTVRSYRGTLHTAPSQDVRARQPAIQASAASHALTPPHPRPFALSCSQHRDTTHCAEQTLSQPFLLRPGAPRLPTAGGCQARVHAGSSTATRHRSAQYHMPTLLSQTPAQTSAMALRPALKCTQMHTAPRGNHNPSAPAFTAASAHACNPAQPCGGAARSSHGLPPC